ncbi:hypothetical protein [Mesonia sp.]|uniref:hypothetical protein n=1 Tax=Mesonia sp. TaxID=1960830 RepID=UPI00176333BB|nr:hypothetical protein [Mesonia sp.]HIB38147.1 hypothetical protein [Mesonia sp.]HIO26185.1 hypothetical protein [Flavobacteriaceae bacterium]
MKKFALTLAVICLFGILNSGFAQGLPSFEDDINDEAAAAPIAEYLLVGLVLGSILGIRNKK